MKKHLFSCLLALITFVATGQSQPLDLKALKKEAQEPSYLETLQRYASNDTSLSLDDYRLLYYGQAFRNDYRPYARNDTVTALNRYLRDGLEGVDFRKVLVYTLPILRTHPFNLEHIYLTGLAYEKLGSEDTAKLWFHKFEKLMGTILSTGDGKSTETAIIVTKISDEYVVLNYLNLQPAEQTLLRENKKAYDILEVVRNEYGIKELYFDITLFYGILK